MSVKAKITITFTADSSDLDAISFDRTNDTAGSGGGPATVSLGSAFVDKPRSTISELEMAPATGAPGEATAMSYEKFFNIDHNFSGIMILSRAINVITIEIETGWYFENFASDVATTVLIAAEIPNTFYLNNASLQVHPTAPCNFVDVEILMSEQATSYTIVNVSESAILVSTNPFTVSVNRTVPTVIIVTKGSVEIDVAEEQFNESHFYFKKIYNENIDINILGDVLLGATVTINVNYPGQLTQRPIPVSLTYSLNGVDFQSSNVWSAQVDGDYTIYVKDGLGCTVQKDFTVAGLSSSRDSFIDISNVNSFTFAKNEVWDGLQNGIHKNIENTLALTGTEKHLYEEKLLIRDKDTVRIQFKSNYSEHHVTLENCAGDSIGVNITPEKMSANLDLFESLDCTLFSHNGVGGIYFTAGDVHNELDVVIGDYELNGNLPDSAKGGTTIDLGAYGIHQVKQIVYDSARNKKAMVFDFDYNGADFNLKMKAYYDLLPFEVYEFNVDFSGLIIHGSVRDQVRIRLQALSNIYDEVNYYTEYILVLSDDDYIDNLGLESIIAINYYNKNNRDIFYLYGISHFLRAAVTSIEHTMIDEVAINEGDLNVEVINSEAREGLNIQFDDVTARMKIKLSLALSSKNLFINGLGYAKKNSLSVEHLENTNLYTISCELISTNKNFNININDDTGISEGYQTLYIPKLLNVGDAYLKI